MILFELIIFLPALIKVLDQLYLKQSLSVKRIFLCLIMLMPPLIFIDHGHFQPNSVMHGLVLWGVYFMIRGSLVAAVISMVLAINFKQNALYFGLPFAFYALGILY